MEPEHQEWKRAVMSGQEQLEDLSTKGVVTAVMAANDNIVRVTPEEIAARAAAKDQEARAD